MRIQSAILFVLIGVLLSLVMTPLTGCGYKLGYQRPANVYKLAIPMFENIVMPLRREVEFDLTRAVRQEFELRTDFQLSPEDEADAVLYGRIERFRESVLTEGARDEVQDAGLNVGVRIRLLRRSDGVELLNQMVHDSTSYSVLVGESVDDARAEAINEIAERIVASLEAW